MQEDARTSNQRRMHDRVRLFHLLIHDMRGPLSIVAAAAENLRHKQERYGPLTEGQERLLDRISRNAGKAQSFIQEMVEILRSDEKLFQIGAFSVEAALTASILDALEMTVPPVFEDVYAAKGDAAFKDVLAKRGILLEISGKYSQSAFCHDQRKIQQIFWNLVSNALKHRRELVGVRVSGEADLVVVVEDDGIGIPLGEHEGVFAPFVQVGDRHDAHASGLGFGLAGVKTLVETMGGDIRLESREGAGTRFMVRIPSMHQEERS